MKFSLIKILFVSFILLTLSCKENPDDNLILNDNFDRAEMLEFWADKIIIPAYKEYGNSLKNLDTQTTAFYNELSIERLNELKNAWLDAYLAWQGVSMFEIGKAEEISLRNFTNIYPANVKLIQANINEGDYNLELPSNFPAQGFPALDYLLFGQGNEDSLTLAALSSNEVETYVKELVRRLNDLSALVLADWNQGYREVFVSNNGSSATASTDKMVNDFLFYYEKHLRAAKVGIPAGIFSGNEEPGLVEGRYSKIYSKQLFEKGFFATKSFFGGLSFDGLTQGISLQQYLNEIQQANKTDVNIVNTIKQHWKNVDIVLENVGDSFENQVIDDNTKMLSLYDELQKAVIPLKVDMLQALNIQVDFVDADGD